MGREISVLESDADKGQQVGVLAAESEGPPATLSRPRDPGLSPPSHPHALFQFSQPLFQVDWAHGDSENRKHVDISGNKGQEIVFRGPRGSRDWELGRDGGGSLVFYVLPPPSLSSSCRWPGMVPTLPCTVSETIGHCWVPSSKFSRVLWLCSLAI